MDEEQTPLQFKQFDISESVSETAESFCDYAKSQGHKLTLKIEPYLRYCGDEYSIRRLTSILIDNAIKYASDGSDIIFSLSKHKKGVEIICKNKCENVESDDLDKLFDRFYRADKSRTESKGFGIGLSMARSIAEAHKGEINASYNEDGEIVFTAVLK